MSQDLPGASQEDRLRARLGKGARVDAPGAPAEALRLARHGMAYFARALNTLSDDDLTGPSRLPDWQRAHVVAHVSIAARAQALALAALRGQDLEDEFDWSPDLDLTATLPARALRHLFDHAHVHLNVEWRDLGSAQWNMTARLDESDAPPAHEMPARQAGRLWWGAVALRGTAAAQDIPKGVPAPRGPLHALADAPMAGSFREATRDGTTETRASRQRGTFGRPQQA